MIECIESTVLPICQRSLDSLLSSEYWHDREGLRFDPDYLAALPSLHGARPHRSFFRDASGTLRRIGWFTTVYDSDADLPGARQEDHMYHDSDTRIVDRSLTYLLDGESSIYRPLEDTPVRYYPFAALHSDPLDSGEPITLCWYFGSGSDSVCFDTSTDPFSVVVCEFEKAMAAFLKYDEDLDNAYDYNFFVPVARSFREFSQMLSDTPKGT